MKYLVIILLLTVVECMSLGLGGYHRSQIDPQRAKLLRLGVTNLDEAIRVLGADPVYTYDCDRGNEATTVVWYSAWGDLLKPETLSVEYIVEARFDWNEKLIDLTVVDHRSDPRERGDANLMLEADADWPASRRIRLSPEAA